MTRQLYGMGFAAALLATNACSLIYDFQKDYPEGHQTSGGTAGTAGAHTNQGGASGAQAGTATTAGTAGTVGSISQAGGGNHSSGGLTSSVGGMTNVAGVAGTPGGATTTGGSTSTGGALSLGGTTATGGSSSVAGATAGTLNLGGTSATGGSVSAAGTTGGTRNLGGTTATGGSSSAGGNTGGAANLGGTTSTGGSISTAGTTGNATQVCVGEEHSCALVNGSVYCWGKGKLGELGNGNTLDSDTPVKVLGPLAAATVDAITCGDSHSCARANQKAYCWGYNSNGELGSVNGSDTISSLPVEVKLNATTPMSGVTDLSAGDSHACAVVSGAVYCWGFNLHGTLGNGTKDNSATPILATGLDSGVTAVAGGGFHTCALKGGAVYCWGSNIYGQLGTGSYDSNDILVPRATVAPANTNVNAISAGWENTCARISSKLYCWGCGNWREFANASYDGGDSASPVEATRVSGFGAVTQFAAGYSNVCAVAGGRLSCWGRSDLGQAGAVTTTPDYFAIPQDLGFAAGSQITSVAIRNHTCAVVNGYVYCWGGSNNSPVTKTLIAFPE